jgi:hypothetical protein
MTWPSHIIGEKGGIRNSLREDSSRAQIASGPINFNICWIASMRWIEPELAAAKLDLALKNNAGCAFRVVPANHHFRQMSEQIFRCRLGTQPIAVESAVVAMANHVNLVN